MKHKNLFLIASLCGAVLLVGGCTSCNMRHPEFHEQKNQDKPHHKKQHHAQKQKQPEIFYQTYDTSNIKAVNANVYTRSSNGGESAMGTISFKETNEGLKMSVDLIDLRPGKTYTSVIYQCFECNESICCSEEAMSVDLPKIKTKTSGRLQESYIIRGLTATQLNNAKIILTRDGGYKAAWGTLLNK